MDQAHSIDEEFSIKYILDCSRGLVETIEVHPWEAEICGSMECEAEGSETGEGQTHEPREPKTLVVQFITNPFETTYNRRIFSQKTDQVLNDPSV